jgi:hypothetical protein
MSTVQGSWRGPNIVRDGLVLYLDAGSPNSFPLINQSTTWKDISGNVNNGVLTNGPTFDTGNGGSIMFDGSDDYITTTTNLGSNPIPSHTISIWFKTTVASGTKLIGVENQQTGISSIYNDRQIYIGTNGRIYYGVYDTAPRNISSSLSLNDGVWHNAVGVCTGTNQILLYIDSILNSTGTGNGFSSYPSSYIRLGGYLLSSVNWVNSINTGYYTGNIAQAQLYNRALSSSEVLQNFNATRARFGI